MYNSAQFFFFFCLYEFLFFLFITKRSKGLTFAMVQPKRKKEHEQEGNINGKEKNKEGCYPIFPAKEVMILELEL